MDFGAEFSFGSAFGGASVDSESFDYDNISCEYSVERMIRLRRRRRRRKRRPNRMYISDFYCEVFVLAGTYRNFTRPGVTRDLTLTHELSSSARIVMANFVTGSACRWRRLRLEVRVDE